MVSLRFYFVYTHWNSACASLRRKFEICTLILKYFIRISLSFSFVVVHIFFAFNAVRPKGIFLQRWYASQPTCTIESVIIAKIYLKRRTDLQFIYFESLLNIAALLVRLVQTITKIYRNRILWFVFPRKKIIVILLAYTTICSTFIIDCTKLGDFSL